MNSSRGQQLVPEAEKQADQKWSPTNYAVALFNGYQLIASPNRPQTEFQKQGVFQNKTGYHAEYKSTFRDVGTRESLAQVGDLFFPTRALPTPVSDELARIAGTMLVNPAIFPGMIAAKVPMTGGNSRNSSLETYVDLKTQLIKTLTELPLRLDAASDGSGRTDAQPSRLSDSASGICLKPEGSTTIEKCATESFLPLILDLSEENGIQWVFIHAYINPNLNGTHDAAEPEVTAEYMATLGAWLAERNEFLIDLRDQRDIPAE